LFLVTFAISRPPTLSVNSSLFILRQFALQHYQPAAG
jgi:hypothetical protein